MPPETAEHALIMVVDDLRDDLVIIRKAFEKARVLNPLVMISSGDEAMDYLRGEGKYANRQEYPLPELILLDLKMPKTDGFEVLQWIRSQPALRSIRVVVLTSSDHLKDVNRAYELGANSFVTKPVGSDAFAELANALRGYWIWHSRAPECHRSGLGESLGKPTVAVQETWTGEAADLARARGGNAATRGT